MFIRDYRSLCVANTSAAMLKNPTQTRVVWLKAECPCPNRNKTRMSFFVVLFKHFK